MYKILLVGMLMIIAVNAGWLMMANTQDSKGHFKAPKFGLGCCQISQFYSSLSQLCVCRHRDYRELWFVA